MEEEKIEEAFFTESKKKVQDYIQDRILLVKLQMVEKVSKLVALMFTGLIMSLFAFFILLFVSIMGGYYFVEVTGSLYLGFGIIVGFYLLLTIVIVVFRKKVFEKLISDTVVRVFFDQTDKQDDNK